MDVNSNRCPTWAKDMLEYVHEVGETKTREITSLIERMGLSVEHRNSWVNIFKTEVKNIFDEMVEEINAMEKKLVDDIEALLKESARLCKELRIEMPRFGDQDLPLMMEFSILEKQVKSFREQVILKKKELCSLKDKELALCKFLGLEPQIMLDGPVPTADEIQQYQMYLEELESKRYTREEEYTILKCEIEEWVQELNYKPSYAFEKELLSGDECEFLLTDETMKKLTTFHAKLKAKYDDTKMNITETLDKLQVLWDVIEIDIKDRNRFIENLPNNTIKKLLKLEAEVKRCEDIKKANIETFVRKMRRELVVFWDKCMFTPDQRQNFIYFHDDFYTEDLLSHHDLEINKLKRFYNDNKEIFILADKREQLWSRKLEFEDNPTSKDRYKNRGGKLLQEEKERNVINKKLPVIEAELLDLAKKYEIQNKTPFLLWGETIQDIIGKSHESYDNDRKNKLSIRKQQRENALTPGKSTLSIAGSRMGSMQSLLKTPISAKRKVATPLVSITKRAKMNEASRLKQIATAPPKIIVTKYTGQVMRNSFDKKRRRSERLSRKFQDAKENIENQSCISEYEDFKNNIFKKDGCRSTIFEPSCARDTATTPNMKRPTGRAPLSALRSSKQLHF